MNIFPIKKAGFTLIEILVAIFIFTIVALIITTGLHTVLSTEARIDKNTERFATLQTALLFMQRDFEQAINRPVSNTSGNQENVFLGEPSAVTFTHAGLFNPFGTLNRSTLQRTHYFLKNNQLIRETWSELDITADTSSAQRILLNDVSELHFNYLDQHQKWQTTFPNNGQEILPRAIRVTIILKDLGRITQLYLIPNEEKSNA